MRDNFRCGDQQFTNKKDDALFKTHERKVRTCDQINGKGTESLRYRHPRTDSMWNTGDFFRSTEKTKGSE